MNCALFPRWSKSLLILCLFLGACPPSAFSQAAPEAFSEAIDVRVVNVEAVVTDRRGNRVPGLAAADFRLLVDGKEVPIDYFTEVADGEATARPAAPGKAGAVPAPVEGVVGRSVLVFVDQGFTIRPQLETVLSRLRDELGGVGGALRPEDRFAVVAFDGWKLKVLTGWTGDPAAIRAALGRAGEGGGHGGAEVRAEREALGNDADLRGSFDDATRRSGTSGRGAGPAESAEPAAAEDLLGKTVAPGTPLPPAGPFGAFESEDDSEFPWKAAAKMQRTFAAATAALRGFAGAPGRKVVLLLAGSWPGELQPQLLPPLIDTANRLGYTLYPVDVAGIESSPVPLAADVFGPGGPGSPNTALISSTWEQDAHYGLEQLAKWTGGKASLNSNRLAALDRLVEDTRSYYWIGFSPTWRGDGRRHAVRLEVRRRGLKARSRGSFTDQSPVAESAMAIEGQLLLGRKATEKTLFVQLGAARWSGLRAVEVPVTLGVPAGALAFVETGDGFQAELPVHVTAFDSTDGPLDLPPMVLRAVVRKVPPPGELVRFGSTLRLRRGEKRLRFTIRDPVHDKLLWGEDAVGGGAAKK